MHRIDQIDPIAYGRSRNFIDGAVTYLSPYISRGVISTKEVMEKVLARGYEPQQIERFLQELAWRDYWQQIWKTKTTEINNDLKNPQKRFERKGMPKSILEARLGIDVLDENIEQLYKTGYVHNHVRMYLASVVCHVGQYHWSEPARWMYYHLLEGDWASNALSWQWVAGTSRQKTYFANQENINKYCASEQRNTFLDVSYEALENMATPKVLLQGIPLHLETELPATEKIVVEPNRPTLIYNYYNVDPNWWKNEGFNRILLLEPEIFKLYPVSPKCLDFLISLAGQIPNLQIYVGSFESLLEDHVIGQVIYKEHPLNKHYKGTEDQRDWMFDVTGYYPSFFSFWKKCKKELFLR